MSTPAPANSPSSFFNWLPLWVLAGFAVGVACLVLLARYYRHESFHENYVRYHPFASPESLYLPTLDEMCGIARGRYRQGQILVLVGGNSIFHGVGQPVDKIWTRRLQDELGDSYCVINFALRGGPISSGAAIVSEVLRDEIPRQIFVANTAPLIPANPIGEKAYEYLTQSAWDRGLLEEIEERETIFRAAWPNHRLSVAHAYNLADGALGFRTLGNALTWRVISTYPYSMEPLFPNWMTPRGSIPDREPDSDREPLAKRYRPEAFDIEMQITRGFSELAMERGPDGRWREAEGRKAEFSRYLRSLRPDDLKKKTLIVTSSNSPYYLSRLTPEEQERDRAALEASAAAWEREGYYGMHYGAGFTETDFVDRTHLTATGGAKLAKQVAAKIRAIAKEQNYE
ncbi:MAG: hypothetical protein SFV32_03065 [Opitutaceae bacterium]|nr:hypothetical protein [Opitutaceae bacterium]